MRVELERTFLTTAEGRAVIIQQPEKSRVDATSLKEAIIAFIDDEGGRLLGTITELPNRAVCTGWVSGRLYVLMATPAAD